MTHEWVETCRQFQRDEKNAFMREYYQRLINDKELTLFMSEKDIKKSITRTIATIRQARFISSSCFLTDIRRVLKRDYSMREKAEFVHLYTTLETVYRNLYKEFFSDNNRIWNLFLKDFRMYEDSTPMEFDGDIIITDPCYILKNEQEANEDYMRLESIGIHGISSITFYGDWTCGTYKQVGEKLTKIGSFCADAGLVAVMDYKDVKKYNPEYKAKNKWSVTLIKNFKGTVRFVIKETSWIAEEDSFFHKSGEKFSDYNLYVVGEGINTRSGKPFNFITKQTGF